MIPNMRKLQGYALLHLYLSCAHELSLFCSFYLFFIFLGEYQFSPLMMMAQGYDNDSGGSSGGGGGEFPLIRIAGCYRVYPSALWLVSCTNGTCVHVYRHASRLNKTQLYNIYLFLWITQGISGPSQPRSLWP